MRRRMSKGTCVFCGVVGALRREARYYERTVAPDGATARVLRTYGHVVCRFCWQPQPNSFVDRRTVVKDRSVDEAE